MLEAIPFKVPAEFAAGIANGSLQRFGALIKEANTGQIVAHLQETGALRSIISSGANITFSPVAAVSSLGANVQLANLQKMVTTLQSLQFASLGATLVGIGVSAIGFKVMVNRFNQVQLQLDNLAENMNQQFVKLEARELRRHQYRVISLLDEASLAGSFSCPKTELLRISHALTEEAAYYRGEVEHQICLPYFNEQTFQPLVQFYTGCNSIRIKCLILAEEMEAAKEVSASVASDYNSIFDHLSPIALAKKSLRIKIKNCSKSFDNSGHQLKEELVQTENLVLGIREAQEVAQTRPVLIKTLIEKDISGKQFIQQLENESEQPILCLYA